MRRIQACIVAGVFFGLAALALAQQKPDFTGEWQLNRQACTLSPAASAIQSGSVRIEHRDPAFRYQATLMSETGKVQYEFELPSDGKEVSGSQGGTTAVSSLHWEADALLLTSRMQLPNGELRITFRYELVDGGRRLRAVEQLRGGGRDQDNVWIFDRR